MNETEIIKEDIKEIKKVLSTIISYINVNGDLKLSLNDLWNLQDIAKKWNDEK